jgi:prephenate dehydrogenase
MRFDQITIVGVGLIGGSIGLAVKSRGLARRVVGVGRDEPTLARAVAAGAIDSHTLDLAAGVRTADLVIVCTPVDRVAEVVLAAVAEAPARAVITDVGSTKGNIARALSGKLPAGSAPFVGSHPLAGSEKKGAAHARADLFLDRPVVVTPLAESDQEAASVVDLFWTALGARVVRMGPDEHDKALATTSHLPHAVAAGLAGVTPGEWLGLTAGGFRDGTRVAAADPDLWAAIFLANRDATLAALDRFAGRMAEFQRLLEAADRDGIVHWLAEGKRIRDALGS